jgi:aspartate aminotransferase
LQMSTLAEQVPASGIREIVNLVFARPDADIVRLEIGEPDFATPRHVAEAAHAAIRDGVGYTQSFGITPLRESICRRLARVAELHYEPDEVVVSQGAVQAVAAAFFGILGVGDEVLIPDPAWPNYEMLALLRGALPRHYSLPAENDFRPDLDEIASLLTDRTRIIVLNSPANPTGAVLPAEVVEAVVHLAADRGIWVLSDEVYDELIFEGEPANAARYGRDHVIGVYSFSKTYAMTGWRVGYAACPRPLARLLGTIQEPLLSCISGVSQLAALGALEGPQECVDEMRSTYRSRRDLMTRLLAEAGFDAVQPSGAFYQMVPLAPGADARRAALELVDCGVATAPGTAFGRIAADHLRLSLAAGHRSIEQGIERIAAWSSATDRGDHLRESP